MRPATFGSNWVVTTPGRYWMGFLYVASVAPSTAPQVQQISNCTYPIPVPGTALTSGIGVRPRGWARTGLSALPTDAFDTTNWSISTASDIPTVGLRRE